jgi:hypothetical protein
MTAFFIVESAFIVPNSLQVLRGILDAACGIQYFPPDLQF